MGVANTALFASLPREESSSRLLAAAVAFEHGVFGVVQAPRSFWRKIRVRKALESAFAAEQRRCSRMDCRIKSGNDESQHRSLKRGHEFVAAAVLGDRAGSREREMEALHQHAVGGDAVE
jgi:hypothetical protein